MQSINRLLEKSKNVRRAFTLIEMLVVVGIIAILIGASLASFNKMMKSAEKAKVQELVNNVATALGALYEADGVWPKKIRETGATNGRLDKDVALVLSKRGYFPLSMDKGRTKLVGKDRFGILTPWASKIVDRKGEKASEGDVVNASSTIEDHILYFAVDLDGNGIIEGANVGGESVDIRATAAVWCVGKSGGKDHRPWPYKDGLKKDDVYSWTKGQTQAVK